jgi:hypothetical protein
MKRILALALVSALVVPFAAFAQAKPDFSGTWTLDEAKSDPPAMGRGGRGGGRGGPAGPVTIKQTATQIQIGDLTYKLDGSESTNTMQGRGGPQEVKSKAGWDGANLVIESSRDLGGMSITTKETRSVTGTVMTVQTSINTPQGEQSRKTVYTKQ